MRRAYRNTISADARAAEWQRRRGTARAARELGLICPAAMFDAVRKTGIDRLAAEMEIRFTGMTHRPATYFLRQIEQACLVCNCGIGFGRNKSAGRRGRDRRLLIAWPLTQEPSRSDRHDFRLIRAGSRSGNWLALNRVRSARCSLRSECRAGRGWRRRGWGNGFAQCRSGGRHLLLVRSRSRLFVGLDR